MSDFAPAATAQIRGMLACLDELYQIREMALRAAPGQGSLAALDLAVSPDARFIGVYAGHSLFGALDHLSAWHTLIHGPAIPVEAHLTVMRGALEGSVRARWHVDSGADSSERVGRAIATRRKDQQERRRFDESVKDLPRPPAGFTADERLAQLDAPDAIAARYAAGVKELGFAHITNLMVQYGLEAPYRLLSGLAHNLEYASRATSITREAGPSPAGVSHAIVTASEPIAVWMTSEAVHAVRDALDALAAYKLGVASGVRDEPGS